jgi:hypothetical protein
VGRTAALWPTCLDAEILWNVVEALAASAWRILADEYGPRGIIIWEDCQPPALAPQMQEVTRRYKEWNEAILLLVTGLDTALLVMRARGELATKLVTLMDRRLLEFIKTGATGIAAEIVQSTRGREYYPERNLSFLRGSVENIFREFKDDPRFATWAMEWSGILRK